MTRHYHVMFGKRGIESFRKLKNAEKFAKIKANKTHKRVEIKKELYYPRARMGNVSSTESHVKYIKPKKK